MNETMYAEELASYQNGATWELKAVRKALSFMEGFNDERQTARLAAVRAILRQRNRGTISGRGKFTKGT